MEVRRENQDEKEEEIQLMLTENLNKTHPLVSKSPIRTEKVKIIVSGGEKSGGTYFFSTEKAEGAQKNKVWKHENNDRYIFSNDSVLGWRIGKKKQLQTGNYLFKSDLESLKLDEEVEWRQNDGSSIYVKCTLCTNEDFETENEIRRIWRIDWVDLRSELCNMMTAWSDREWKDIGIGFSTGLITLSFSIFDITSDGLVAKSFLLGTDYIKEVTNQTDLIVTNNKTNCTLIGHNVFHSTIENAEKMEDFYRFSCFEYDVFWGLLAILFVLLPGAAFSALNAIKLRQAKSSLFWLFLLMSPLTTVLFPLLLISVKIICLFHNGAELTRLNNVLTFAEGQFESFCQLGLQLYIIFSRADRQPSLIQMITLPASALMLVRVQVNSFYAKVDAASTIEDVKRKLFMAPIFLLKSIFFLGSSMLVAVINPIVFLTHLIAYLIVTGILALALRYFSKKKKEWYLKIFLIFVMVIFSWPLGLTIWAMEAVKNSFQDYAHIHIVKNNYFNTFAALIISSEVLYFILFLVVWLGDKAPKGTRDILFFLPIGL